EWEIHGVAFSHPIVLPGTTIIQTDLRNYKNLKNLFKTVRPQAVMHTAALSDPNVCQLHREETQVINVEASLQIAGLCADSRIPCLFTSSDLVFDGLHPPYSEKDLPGPINRYGEQKVLAEAGMQDRYPETIICRLPLMFGESGPMAQSFLQPMLKALREDRDLHLFVDEFRTPISGKTAAQGLFLALTKAQGIIHLGGRERISRYDFGLLLKKSLKSPRAELIPCCQKDIKMPAPRPPDVSLNSAKAFSLGYNPPPLMEALKDSLEIR
ncbi:MAG: NAD(P)-dependent oxidoreductase, partial [Desulfobacca sp.]|nr:NAD(P)-dependent oxidoreductase [Desulfobacca sp.]